MTYAFLKNTAKSEISKDATKVSHLQANLSSSLLHWGLDDLWKGVYPNELTGYLQGIITQHVSDVLNSKKTKPGQSCIHSS